jgi:hypothetical protein
MHPYLGWSTEFPTPVFDAYEPQDSWMVEQTIDDLPSETTWETAGKVTKYSPRGVDFWLDVTDSTVFTLKSIMELRAQERAIWKPMDAPYLRAACVKIVNDNLARDSGALLLGLLARSWGVHQGRVCHHPSEYRCAHCGLNRQNWDYHSALLKYGSFESFEEDMRMSLAGRLPFAGPLNGEITRVAKRVTDILDLKKKLQDERRME